MRAARAMMSALVMTIVGTAAAAQQDEPPLGRTLSLSGPRLGVTFLSPGIVSRLDENSIGVRPVVSQFGWQFEKQFLNAGSGPTAVSEWVLLFGGMEQGTMLPSLTWLVGLRSRRGAELGVGPNLSPAGTGRWSFDSTP